MDGVVFANVDLTLKYIEFSGDLSSIEPAKLAQLVSVSDGVNFSSVKLTLDQMKYIVQFSNEAEMWRVEKMFFINIQKDCIDSKQIGLLARNISEVWMDNVTLKWSDFERGFLNNSLNFNGRCRKLSF